jgi:FixJ family two-component response regulator
MIAVVDDDAAIRKAVVRLLRSVGYASRSFASGQELVAAWGEAPPDCLVLDLQLSGTSGLELHRMLRSAGVLVPTIVITAVDEARVLTECMREGACACLSKPIEDRLLIAAIERALAWRRPVNWTLAQCGPDAGAST